MDAHPGEFVYASAGRDEGKSRKDRNPKKKKIKHVRLTGDKDEFIVNKLETVGKLTNKEVRYSLNNYLGVFSSY